MKRRKLTPVLMAVMICGACISLGSGVIEDQPDLQKDVFAYEKEGSTDNKDYENLCKALDEVILLLRLPEGVTPEIYRRFLAEGIDLTWDFWTMNVTVKDIDNNGIDDIFITKTYPYEEGAQEFYLSEGSYFYIAMNEDEIFTHEATDVMAYFGGRWEGADIDQDGNVEIVFSINTGGNGAAGSCDLGVFKYQNHTLTEMKLPDEFKEPDDFKPSSFYCGLHIGVYFGKTKDEYTAYCEYLDQTVSFKRVITEGFNDHHTETESGAGCNVRGYTNFDIISRDGREYLVLDEYLAGEMGNSHYVGTATFLVDWNKEGEPQVLEFAVGSYDQEVYGDLRRPVID